MSGKIAVFKGTPRWRDWSFWLIIFIFCRLVAWKLHQGKSVLTTLMWSPLYLVNVPPHRAWLGSNFLISVGPSWFWWTFRRFDFIESYSYFDLTRYGLPAEDEISVSLTIINEKANKKAQNVTIYVQKGSSLEEFLQVMQQHQVPSLLQTLNETFAAPPIFNPPFSDLEAERDALYALLARRKPELKW